MVKAKGKIFSLFIVAIIFVSQSYLLSAFEAHIINVTAKICTYSETRTMGYWKNHPEVRFPHLSLYLGDELIDTQEKVDEIFDNANAKEMVDMLKGQLLAMKFNIAHFGIGGYFVESEGKTLSQIVDEADDLLRQEPLPERAVLEAMKTLLDDLNNLHQIRYCGNIIFEPGVLYKASDQCLKINEVYYASDDEHGGTAGQWVELYNSCEYEIDLWGWTLQDNAFPEVIAGSYIIESQQFAVIAANNAVWQYWPGIPQEALLIEQGRNQLFNGLDKPTDFLYLYDNRGNEVDLVAWGGGIMAFTPPVPDVLAGHSIARNPKGYDTDSASDWVELETPNPGTNPHTSPLVLAMGQETEPPVFDEPVEEPATTTDEQTATTTEPVISLIPPISPVAPTTSDATTTQETSATTTQETSAVSAEPAPSATTTPTTTDSASAEPIIPPIIPIAPTTTSATSTTEQTATTTQETAATSTEPLISLIVPITPTTSDATSTDPTEPPVDTETE